MVSESSNVSSGSSDVSNGGEGDGTWVKVADLSECPPGSLLDVEAGRESVVLANIDLERAGFCRRDPDAWPRR